MRLARWVAVALIWVLSVPGLAQAISVSRSSVDLGASPTSVKLGGLVTLRGTLHTDRRCHNHHEVSIFRDGVSAATVSTDASGRFSYSYTASRSSTWSAMFRGETCGKHGDERIIESASESRSVTVVVKLNREAKLPYPHRF